MTQYEFQTRVQMNISAEEYSHIEEVYMSSDLDKDEFCKLWVKMNKTRVAKAKAEAKAKQEADELHSKVSDMYWCKRNLIWEQGCGLADKEFNTFQKSILKKVGIQTQEKTTSTVLYEMAKFLKVA